MAHRGPEAQLLGLRRLLQGLQLLVVRALLPATRPQLRLPRSLVSGRASLQAARFSFCSLFRTMGSQVDDVNLQHMDSTILIGS